MAVAYPRSTPAARVGVAMEPVHPPFPLASSLPFQLWAGSQTSILISESLEGLRVAATRQYAGRVTKGLPAAIGCANVMDVLGSASFCRSSQDAAEVRRAASTKTKI